MLKAFKRDKTMAFVCVHVCARVCTCKPVCTQTPTRGCGGGRSMPGVLLCGPPLFYTRRGLSELEAHLAGQRAPRNLPVCFSVLGLRNCHAYMCFYFYVIQAQVFIFAQQELLPTEPSLQPSLMNLLPVPSPILVKMLSLDFELVTNLQEESEAWISSLLGEQRSQLLTSNKGPVFYIILACVILMIH